MAGNGKRAIIAAFFANLGIAVAKFVGFLFTASASLLAESIHSVADTANQALLLLGGRRAARQATEEHPFGYGRERYFWAFVVALVLFSLGSLFAIFEGVEKLRHPHELESPEWAIGILLVAIVLEGYSFRTAVHESRPLKGDAGWWAFIRRAKQPELPVVLMEDSAALAGLVVALAAVAMAIVTDDAAWDGLGSLVIGGLLGFVATVLAIEMKSLLIGESALPSVVRRIERAINEAPPVTELIHLRTEHLGPEDLLVGAKIHFDAHLSMEELSRAIDEVETLIREAVPTARVIYVEPDIRRDAEPAG